MGNIVPIKKESMSLNIDEEFQALVPPLSVDEYNALEQNIIDDGCRDALVTWNDLIIDGHNRYKICKEHGLNFLTTEKSFEDREEAKIWIKKNQLGRRNIPAYLKGEYYLEIEEWENLRAKGKENEKRGRANLLQNQGVTKDSPAFPNSEKPEKINTTKELANKIGIGNDTASRIIQIRENASPEQKARLRSGEASVNEVYTEIRNADSVALKMRMYERLKENIIPELTDKFENVLKNDPSQIDGILKVAEAGKDLQKKLLTTVKEKVMTGAAARTESTEIAKQQKRIDALNKQLETLEDYKKQVAELNNLKKENDLMKAGLKEAYEAKLAEKIELAKAEIEDKYSACTDEIEIAKKIDQAVNQATAKLTSKYEADMEDMRKKNVDLSKAKKEAQDRIDKVDEIIQNKDKEIARNEDLAKIAKDEAEAFRIMILGYTQIESAAYILENTRRILKPAIDIIKKNIEVPVSDRIRGKLTDHIHEIEELLKTAKTDLKIK